MGLNVAPQCLYTLEVVKEVKKEISILLFCNFMRNSEFKILHIGKDELNQIYLLNDSTYDYTTFSYKE